MFDDLTLNLDVGHVGVLVTHKDVEGSKCNHHLQVDDLTVGS